MKSLAKVLFGATLLLAGAAQAYVPTYLSLNPNGTLDGEMFRTSVYVNATFKINDRYNFSPETLNHLSFRSEGKNSMQLSHEYLRFLLNDKSLAKFGRWTLGMTYRYTAPTTMSAQAEGSLGTLKFRPSLAAKYGWAELFFRTGGLIYLQRDGHQVNPSRALVVTAPTDVVAKGNSLLGWDLEILPTFQLGNGFFVSPQFTLALVYKGKPKLASGAFGDNSWSRSFVQEYIVGYTSPKIWDINVMVSVANESDFSTGKDFAFFTRKTASYNLYLERAF